MTTREQLHDLINRLPEDELRTAERLLNGLCAGNDPVLRALLTAAVVEPLPDEMEAFAQARKRVAAGSSLISHDDVRREVFGDRPQRPRRASK